MPPVYIIDSVAPGRILEKLAGETVRVHRFGPHVHNQAARFGIRGTHRDAYNITDADAVCSMLNRRAGWPLVPPGTYADTVL